MKKGFTLIELVVVIALISILAVTLAPKVLAQINKSKVSKVIQELEDLRRDYRILGIETNEDPQSAEELRSLLKSEYTTLETPNIYENNSFYDERTDEGGWLFYDGELFANLPNGAYTGDPEKEIWFQDTLVNVTTGENLGSFGDGNNSDFEYDPEKNALVKSDNDRKGFLYFNPENTGFSELTSVTIKTNSKLAKNNGGWELISSEGDVFTYKKTYEKPKNITNVNPKKNRQNIKFKNKNDNNLIYEISYDGNK